LKLRMLYWVIYLWLKTRALHLLGDLGGGSLPVDLDGAVAVVEDAGGKPGWLEKAARRWVVEDGAPDRGHAGPSRARGLVAYLGATPGVGDPGLRGDIPLLVPRCGDFSPKGVLQFLCSTPVRIALSCEDGSRIGSHLERGLRRLHGWTQRFL
jgi:hypothetical protein